MKLNHLNLTVTDVTATLEFLETYFGLRNRGGNRNMAFMSDDNGMVLTLTSMKVGRETEVKYPSTFHIGFIQESEEGVNEINRRLGKMDSTFRHRAGSMGRGHSISLLPAGSQSKSSAD